MLLRIVASILLAGASGVMGQPALAEPTAAVARAQREARAQRLWTDPQWIRLGHYRYPRSGPVGEVDDARFFLSPGGKTDPEAELLATIAALYAEVADDDEHPVCRFPARREWLQRRLGTAVFDPPQRRCDLYREWRASVPDAQLTLVFPAYHLNSPSSMFGHTLLRLDPADLDASSDWLSIAVNFGADVRAEDNSLFYAFKGLSGGYPGFFIVTPYYKKIREYNFDEKRDIWEYRLDLRPEEIRFMATHLWELKTIRFDYYFFDENCSYRLLELIEVARPTLDLTSGFGLTAIPVDTVRAIERAGLVKATSFRPSQVTVIERGLEAIPASYHDMVLRLADEPEFASSPEFRVLDPALRWRLIDTAYKILRYRIGSSPREAVSARRSYELLAQLSALAPPASVPAGEVPGRPETGHGSRRASIGAGRRDGRDFVDLGFRMSFHSLEDPEHGFLRGAQINLGSVDLRASTTRLRLQRLDFVDIFSLTPRSAFFSPYSWRVIAGLERQPGISGDVLTGHVTGGMGGSYALWQGSILYAIAGGRLERNPEFARVVDPALGGIVGIVQHFGSHTAHLQAGGERFENGHLRRRLSYVHSFALTANQALRVHVLREAPDDRRITEGGVAYQVFFW